MARTVTRSGRVTRRAEHGATAAVAIKVAHSLYRRWEALAPSDRERLRELAGEVKRRALDLRGKLDRTTAERELSGANVELATAIRDSAESDPEVDTTEFERLRAELGAVLGRRARQQH